MAAEPYHYVIVETYPISTMLWFGCLLFGAAVRLFALWAAGRKEQKKRYLIAVYSALAAGVAGILATMGLLLAESAIDATMIFLSTGFLCFLGGSVRLLRARQKEGKPPKKIHLIAVLAAIAVGVGGVIANVFLIESEYDVIGSICAVFVFCFYAFLILIALIRCILGILNRLRAKKHAVI